IPAATSSGTASGTGKVRKTGAAATSANAPIGVVAATRWPGARPLPSGALRTVPAISLPGTNGAGSLIWYSPPVTSIATKPTPAASTSINARPSAPSGSGISSSFRAEGPSVSRRNSARMARDHMLRQMNPDLIALAVQRGLAEDVGDGDVTTQATVPPGAR